VLNNYTVTPNYAKSTSSQYVFYFSAYNPVAGVMSLTVGFPALYILTTATNCQIKLDTSTVSGTTCSFDSTTNQVIIPQIARFP
jgi:hypothetical protein